jgi:Reverse transcriptase (RNA-dependent DNA polymerase)
METSSFLFLCWDWTVGKVFADERFPAGQLFIAPIQPQIHGKPYGATDVMTGDRIVREGIRVVTMVLVASHILKQTAHMLAQGVIEDQGSVGLRTADSLRLLEEIRDPTVIDTLLEPRRFREKSGQISFVSAFQDAAGDVRQAFVVQDDQTCQVILEMLKLTSILEEVPEDVGMRGHEGSRGHDRKLHQALPFHGGGGIGPERIIRKSEMANHNCRGTKWFIDIDIKGYFDNINHEILMEVLKKRIEDTQFLDLIRDMLKAGYVEDWQYHKTYSGTPQGGIVSPILA